MKALNKKHTRPLILLFAVIVSYALPLAYLLSDITIAQDWGFFNGISHVVRSSILHYKTLPIHDPWVLGGVDMFANPQSRIFSPFILFDILFTAPFANLLSLITLGIIGVWGMYKLLEYLEIDKNIALLGAIIFINASWFSLHYSEGHITFGAFQLLGLSLYIILRTQEKEFKIYYALLNAFFILDGAIYMFIFTNLLFVISIILQLHKLSIKQFFISLIKQWKTLLLSLIIFMALSSAKLIPFLWLHGGREPIMEFIIIDINTFLHAFFDPFQYLNKNINNEAIPFRFHEIGVYIGVLGPLMVLIYFIISKKRIKLLKYIIIAALFLWTGAGWLPAINPWHIWHKLPILNNAHVQPRLFIITYLMFIILLSFALDRYKKTLSRSFFNFLIILLLAESVIVSAYPFKKLYEQEHRIYSSKIFNAMITSNTIEKTMNTASRVWGYKFLHYFRANTGAKHATDPAWKRGKIKTIHDHNYRGEIYLNTGMGEAKLLAYTPGKVKIEYKLDTISEIQLNINYLLGWKSKDDVNIYKKDGLLTLEPNSLEGKALIKYRPPYIKIIFPLFIFGIIVLIFTSSSPKRQ